MVPLSTYPALLDELRNVLMITTVWVTISVYPAPAASRPPPAPNRMNEGPVEGLCISRPTDEVLVA
jgi:hypothetical protein